MTWFAPKRFCDNHWLRLLGAMSSFVARELFPKPVEGGSVLAMDILAKKFREQTLEEAANPNASQIKFVSKLPYCFSKKQNGARHIYLF